ncbi:uncharacterized protein LOC115675885 isoform X2 [Syzygium oleosum]|uniref:uncharacterized protein LOC115675885 isoform X2 n=1 Tax=Syzygium oleosum TaxID=219896 RepID=UPI0024B888DC|nr:uncharacterized protein LOC115675885 isoform X2 [Syzygium oleosum]
MHQTLNSDPLSSTPCLGSNIFLLFIVCPTLPSIINISHNPFPLQIQALSFLFLKTSTPSVWKQEWCLRLHMSTTSLVTLSHCLTGADAGQRSRLVTSRQMDRCRFADSRSMASLCARQSTRTMDVAVRSSIDPVPHLPSDPSPSSWKFWVVGVFVSVILPFWRNKWGPLWKLKNEVEAAVETVEHVTDIVEEVADKVEQVAEEVAEHLPEGKLKDMVTSVEHLAETAGKDAHLAGDIIDKVEEVEKEVDSFMEPGHVKDGAGEISKGGDEQDQKS